MVQWIVLLVIITFATVLLGAVGALKDGLRFVPALPMAMLAAAIIASRTIVYRDSGERAFKALAEVGPEPDERR